MLDACSSEKSASAPTPMSTSSKPSVRTARSSNASSAILVARKTSSVAATSTVWRAPPPVWPSARWCFPSSTKARRRQLACTRIGPPLLFERLWRDTQCGEVLQRAARRSRLRVSGRARRLPYRPPSADGVRLRPRLRAMARRTIASTAPTACSCITSTAPWPGSARNCRRPIRRPHPGRALRQGSRRGAAVRPPAIAVHRSFGRVHGHHLAVFRGRGRRHARRARPLQGLPAAAEPDDRRRHHRPGGPAGLLGDVARQHRRRHHPDPGDRPAAQPLRHRAGSASSPIAA